MTLEAEKKQNSSIFKLTTIHGCTLLTTKGDRKGGEIASKRELERKTKREKNKLTKNSKIDRERGERAGAGAGAGAGAEEREQVLE